MDVGLHRADLVQGFVDIGAHVGDPVLARAREFSHAPAEQQDRSDHEGHAEHHERRELGTGDHQHHQCPEHDERVPQRKRSRGADHHFQERRVVGEARDRFAGAYGLEEPGRLFEQVPEHRPADIGRNALADPGHGVETRIGRQSEHADDGEQGKERRVQGRGVAAREAGIDDALQALAQDEHAAGGDPERDARDRHARTVRPEKPQHPFELADVAVGRALGDVVY